MIHFSEGIKRYLKYEKAEGLLQTKKIENLTDYVVYKCRKKDVYFAADKKGHKAGYMVAYPEHVEDSCTYYANMKNYVSLFIKRLYVEKDFRGKGIGGILLKIASKISHTPVCKGKVHLIAERIDFTAPPPHKFYRKHNFDSQQKWQIELIDKAIKNKEELPNNIPWKTPMFLSTSRNQ